jgi:hypothetical protein
MNPDPHPHPDPHQDFFLDPLPHPHPHFFDADPQHCLLKVTVIVRDGAGIKYKLMHAMVYV